MPYGSSRRKTLATSCGAVLLAVALGFFVFPAFLAVAQEAQPAATPADDGQRIREEIVELNQTIKAKKGQVEDLQQQIEGYNQKIQDTKGKTASLENEVELITNKLKKAELDVEQTQKEIDTANLEIRALDLQVQDTEALIAAQKDVVGEYLRTLAIDGDRSELEVMLANDSFSEFFDQVKQLEDIEEDLSTSLDKLVALRGSLEEERGRKEAKKRSLAELQKRLDQTRLALDETKDTRVVLLASAQESETSLRRSLQELRNEQARIDADLASIEAALKEKLRRSDRFAQLSGDVILSWPVDPSRGITTYFHDPEYPFRYVFEHPGLDIRAGQGTPVRAAAPGFVGRAHDGGMGYSYVLLVHSEGISTVYGHLSRIVVDEDAYVERGQVIGYSGATPGTAGAGRLTTGPHLHFEVRSNGIPVDPLDYLVR